jgi:protein-S-isoprenylcysteine O-methyltransferase Ste14
MKMNGEGHRLGARLLEVSILFVLPILVPYLFPMKILIAKPYSLLGILLMLLGLALMSWVGILFRREGASFQLQGKSAAFVTQGLFRASRNPMYLGMLIWLLGLAVLFGSLTAFLFPLLFFLLANFFIIPIEEKSMQERFGLLYAGYKQKVRRWL